MSKRKFYFIVLLQVLFLIGMIIYQNSISWWGDRIVLKIEPIDPHSLFSGEYVALNYDISTVNLSEVAHPGFSKDQELQKYFSRGSKVYVQISPDGDTWKAVKLSKKRLDMGQPYLAARVVYAFQEQWPEGRIAAGPQLRVQYGIESYYTPEGEAQKYERGQSQAIKARIAVDRWGRSRVIDLISANGDN